MLVDEVIEHQEQEIDTQEVENVVDDMQQDVAEDQEQESEFQGKQVPLEALQKERRKRQEAEMNASYQYQQVQNLQQQQAPKEPEDDSYKYQSATQEEVQQSQQETLRIIEEKLWVKANPEKKQRVDNDLGNFLKQRPNLTTAISSADNRYEEAYTLMDALSPRQQQQLRSPQARKEAPNSPASIPKAVSMNATVDIMSMNDKEFREWRSAKQVRR